MSRMKAVVLEKSGSRYTVLCQDGTFRQVHRRLNAEVGEEVQIRRWNEYFSGVRIWAGAVALFLLVLTTVLGWTLYQAPTAVALLSVDINPSLQFELDKKGNFMKFQNLNEDAKRMLGQIDLKGKPIEEVLEQIVTQAYNEKFLSSQQPWVVIGYSPMNNKTLEQMPKDLNESQISSWVTEIGEKKGLTPQVTVFSLNSQEKELAQKGELTLGEYALWQTADKAGVVTQPQKLKNTSERMRLLENPQVQAQIKSSKAILPKTSDTGKQDSGSIGRLVERDTGKLLPAGKFLSPFELLDPRIDKSRSRAVDQQKEQDNDKDDQKNQDTSKGEDKQKAKDQEKYLDQDRDKDKDKNKDRDQDQDQDRDQDRDQDQGRDQAEVKNREYEETKRTTYNRTYTPENLNGNTSRTNNFPNLNWNNQLRR